MNCPNCGNEVFSGEMFCDNCGADLTALQTPAPAPPPLPLSDAGLPSPPPPVVAVEPPIVTPPSPPPPVVAPPPALGPRLVLKESGAVFSLTPGKETVVGRTDPIDGIFPDIDLTPHDTLTGVSRRHAAIHEQGGQWFIRDLNSTNYTVVNRQRLQPGQDFLIEAGDEIRFGRLTTNFQR